MNETLNVIILAYYISYITSKFMKNALNWKEMIITQIVTPSSLVIKTLMF